MKELGVWLVVPSLVQLLAHAVPISIGLIFPEDGPVYEAKTPLELHHFLEGVHDEGSTCAARFVMLYSGWCPHCHAFQPVWSAVASRLQCDETSHLKFGAFECVLSNDDRRTHADQWPQTVSQPLLGHLESSPYIYPNDICQTLLTDAYPTLLLATTKDCELTVPWTSLPSHSRNVTWTDFFGPEYNMYHFPVESVQHAEDTIMHHLERSDIAPECLKNQTIAELDMQVALYLHSLKKSTYKPSRLSSRWSPKAQDFAAEARLHDAVKGLYHVLGSWVLSDRTKMTQAQFSALLNLLLSMGVSLPSRADRRTIGDFIVHLYDTGSENLNQSTFKNALKERLQLSGVKHPDNFAQPQIGAASCETPSCTIWTLFHVLGSLQVLYEQKSSLEDLACWDLFGSSEAKDRDLVESIKAGHMMHDAGCLDGRHLAEVMYDTIFNFFSCKECRAHFHDGFTSCAGDRCMWLQPDGTALRASLRDHNGFQAYDESIATTRVAFQLWLWRFHNIVNVRTGTERMLTALRQGVSMKTLSSDGHDVPMFREDVRLPTSMMCQGCRTKETPEITLDERWMRHFVPPSKEDILVYDYHRDFNLIQTSNFLQSFYTHSQWARPLTGTTPSEGQQPRRSYIDTMEWNGKSRAFELSPISSHEDEGP